jgi:hypothetical protein
MSPFSFFKKKDKDISKINTKVFNRSNSSSQSDDIITIDFALEEINKKEENIIKNQLEKLRKTCEETIQSYETINNIAENLEIEEINAENDKLAPLVNNTKKVIVKSLKRESSNELQIPESFEDLVKFKETIFSSINRFGEVTSSHITVINTFMKKHANNLRSELKRITGKSEKINEYYEYILEDKEIIDDCKNNLLELSNKIKEISNNNNIRDSLNQKIKEIENENNLKEKEIKQLRALPSYNKSLDLLKEIENLEKEKEIQIQGISEITHQLSKAAHKYSYGTSKGTKEIINTIIKDPVKIVNETDISPYVAFLNNLKESIISNKILLKDSNKVIQNCEKMIESLPKFKVETKEIISKIKYLKEHNKNSPLEKTKKIEDTVNENKKIIHDENLRREEIRREEIQEEDRIKQLTNKIEEQLFIICKKKYKIDSTQIQ